MIHQRLTTTASLAARSAHRPVPRSSLIHTVRLYAQKPRFQSTSIPNPNTSSSSSRSSSTSPALIGALTGSLTTLTLGYLWYRQSGAADLISATKSAKSYAKSATTKLKDATPEPSEALAWLRNTTKTYAAFIPGARGYVDAAFDDLDAIHAKHGDEVDKIVTEAYEELRDVAGNGELSLLTAQKAWNVIVKHLGRIGDLAGDAAQQIMDNHPQLKEKVGGNLDQLKELSDKYGPDAKKEAEETWAQISDIVKTGLSAENVDKVQRLVKDKVDKIKQIGDEAWKKGLERAKPYLEKNPQVKKIVEENADTLKQGNVQELYEKIKNAVQSGDAGDLESYVKSFAQKSKDSGLGGLDQYIKKIPGGDQIIPKLSQIQEVAQKHGDEAQTIMKEAVSEILEVLKKKGDEAVKLAEKAKEESKKN